MKIFLVPGLASRILWAGVGCLLLLSPGPAPADTVELRGGRSLDGIVIEETPDAVVLDIGMGRMSFDRDQVVRIVRSSEDANRGTRAAWERRYVSEKDLPDDLKPLYRDWDRLQAIRKRAIDGGRALDRKRREQVRLRASIEAARKEYAAVTQDLARMEPGRNVKPYNQTVKRYNELVARLSRDQAALATGEEAQGRLREDISRYARELTRFENDFHPAHRRYLDADGDDVARAWLERTASALTALDEDFSRISVAAAGSTDGTRLKVTLNDRESGTFILDTGASIVTLTEPMARRLKLRYDPDRPILLRLANGQSSEGYPVVLDAVSVGDARAEQVAAVVVPSAPGPGVEGLLGMSFLGRFEMSFDAASDRLELRKLRAR